MKHDTDAQRLMDLEDVALRHNRLVRLLDQQAQLACEVKLLQAQLASAKRKLDRVTSELQDLSFLERKKAPLSE